MHRYLFIFLFLFFFSSCSANNQESQQQVYQRVKTMADSAAVFCAQKDMNTEYCMLVDMKIHSGKERFFIWSFEKDTIIASSLCGHGYGGESTTRQPVFSNVEGSYCTSLGKYRIGARSYSNWGINIHYKMHGLEDTNSNAYKRIIVLHSHTPVPDKPIYPKHLPLGYSQGCPVINDQAMKFTDDLLKTVKQPVLLWIYY